MTDGSLSTMPRPFMYTSVFAVPRSIARSRATSPLPGAGVLALLLFAHAVLQLAARLGRQGVDVPAEADDAGLLARPAHDEEDDHGDDHHGDDDDDRDDHLQPLAFCADGTSDAVTGACAPVPQPAPPSHSSCFQIGADALTASIAKRAAAN